MLQGGTKQWSRHSAAAFAQLRVQMIKPLFIFVNAKLEAYYGLKQLLRNAIKHQQCLITALLNSCACWTPTHSHAPCRPHGDVSVSMPTAHMQGGEHWVPTKEGPRPATLQLQALFGCGVTHTEGDGR